MAPALPRRHSAFGPFLARRVALKCCQHVLHETGSFLTRCHLTDIELFKSCLAAGGAVRACPLWTSSPCLRGLRMRPLWIKHSLVWFATHVGLGHPGPGLGMCFVLPRCRIGDTFSPDSGGLSIKSSAGFRHRALRECCPFPPNPPCLYIFSRQEGLDVPRRHILIRMRPSPAVTMRRHVWGIPTCG